MRRIFNRAGFYRLVGGTRQYLVSPHVFRDELCRGFDPKTAVRVLQNAGWLEPGGDPHHPTQKQRLPGMGPTRSYVFTEKIWTDGT